MPSMANITVKKNDGTTDVVYTALTPSAGDKVAAQWRDNSLSTVAAHRPQFSLKSEEGNNSRRLTGSFWYPCVETVSGVPTVVARIPITVNATIAKNVADSHINEAVSQCFNLLNSTLVKDSFKSGYAPT